VSQAQKRRLARVGEITVKARMTDAEVERDPVKAMNIAMDAMRATLGLEKPK
jgi:hypothetical protein